MVRIRVANNTLMAAICSISQAHGCIIAVVAAILSFIVSINRVRVLAEWFNFI